MNYYMNRFKHKPQYTATRKRQMNKWGNELQQQQSLKSQVLFFKIKKNT
jgi:hypothetical protein